MSAFAAIKSKFESLRPALDERLCRLWAAAEARAIGRGGVTRVCAATGLSHKTVVRGLHELQRLDAVPAGSESSAEPPPDPAYRREHDRIRRLGAGRKLTEVKDPGVIAALEQMLVDEVAGDPMGEQRWVRSSLRHLSERLTAGGHLIGTGAVARLLKGMGFSLRTNKRKQGTSGRCPERDEQFRYIASQRQSFAATGLPIISVETKKRELIGNFRNSGRAWAREAPQVDEHDFPSQAECSALPFGIYDSTRNRGYVVVGLSHNTPGVRGEHDWPVVAGGRTRHLSQGCPPADPGRWRRWQREPIQSLEGQSAAASLQPLPAGSIRLSLPAWVLEVESG
jgi:hypothetical protein